MIWSGGRSVEHDKQIPVAKSPISAVRAHFGKDTVNNAIGSCQQKSTGRRIFENRIRKQWYLSVGMKQFRQELGRTNTIFVAQLADTGGPLLRNIAQIQQDFQNVRMIHWRALKVLAMRQDLLRELVVQNPIRLPQPMIAFARRKKRTGKSHCSDILE
jgi:hypothetical protein